MVERIGRNRPGDGQLRGARAVTGQPLLHWQQTPRHREVLGLVCRAEAANSAPWVVSAITQHIRPVTLIGYPAWHSSSLSRCGVSIDMCAKVGHYHLVHDPQDTLSGI